MQPLTTCRRVLTWLGVCPISGNVSKFERFDPIVVSFLIISSVSVALVASMVFFVKFLSVDLEKSLQTLLQIAGALSILYSFIVLYISRNKISAVFDHLKQIFDASKIFFRSIKIRIRTDCNIFSVNFCT